jgi:putative flippase GtrA
MARDWQRRGELRKAAKYTAVSVISVAVSQFAFIMVYGVIRWGPRASAIFATCVGTVPSYYLNRNWAWGKRGRSHLLREVLPFWALAFVGLVFSTWAADFAHTHTRALDAHHHIIHTAAVTAAYLGAFGVLWVGKFIIFNRWMFVHHDDPEPSLSRDA